MSEQPTVDFVIQHNHGLEPRVKQEIIPAMEAIVKRFWEKPDVTAPLPKVKVLFTPFDVCAKNGKPVLPTDPGMETIVELKVTDVTPAAQENPVEATSKPAQHIRNIARGAKTELISRLETSPDTVQVNIRVLIPGLTTF